MFIPLEYAKILVYVLLSFGLSSLLLFVSLRISPKEYDAEKLSAYECGFTPLGDARQPFHVRFYVVGILFILFDLEVVFIFPWAVSLETLKAFSPFALYSMLVFLILLTLGFVYEWQKGALEWE
jgi:NADH-quinone oxidoreductase subunit A